VYTFNIDELYDFNKSCTKKTIFAIYGHTSRLDIIYLAWSGIRSGEIIVLAKKKYKWMYPKFCHKYILFIDSNTTNKSKFQFENHGALLIEGTRSKTPYIRTGFKYLAKNNDAQIVFWINNYRKGKLQLSTPISYENDDNTILTHLKHFIEKIPLRDYSIYPDYLSDIKFKSQVTNDLIKH